MSSPTVRTSTIGSVTLVVIVGDIDLASAPELREGLLSVPSRNVVLDLSGVRWLTAAGLTVLLELLDRLQKAGAILVLAAAPTAVRRIVRMTELEVALPMASTVGEAIGMLMPVSARGPVKTGAARAVWSCRRAVRITDTPP
ncbi:STAS domain-containing protein [Pseudonocardia bannensis]|uniref:STAS domain-containing protein n=1 Tax=Pseudonocardia bannensis TaxID=630973 RepID=UPI002483347A|nr:STAS domain-containing protein [Pseudonocardia bannensis]